MALLYKNNLHIGVSINAIKDVKKLMVVNTQNKIDTFIYNY